LPSPISALIAPVITAAALVASAPSLPALCGVVASCSAG
jgi:hypothetical protein